VHVANIMSRVIVTAAPDLTASRLIELLVDENIGAIPVIDDDGVPLGVVTRSDVLEEDGLQFGEEVTAADLMGVPPLTITPETTVCEAAKVMARLRVHHLLVVDDQGLLVGLLSSFDVVRWVAEGADRAGQSLADRTSA
jgi:CBS domain-containing protein